MQELHSHPHYEVYFLTKGNRSFFLADALYKVSAPALVAIPPHVMHKTEGGAFERYNVNVSPDYLDPFQVEALSACALQFLQLTDGEAKRLSALFEEGCAIPTREKHAEHRRRALFGYLVLTLHHIHGATLPPVATTENHIPPVLLKVIDHFNAHYAEPQTLDALSKAFFLPKATLIYNFKKYTNCSPIDFLLNVRLTKAKELLVNTNKSVGEISEMCGFSSANYFGLIFKKKENLSPLQYRKNQRSKV